MANKHEPLQELTPDDRGAICTATVFVCIVSLVGVTGARVTVTVRHRLGMGFDDVAFFLSTLFAIVGGAMVQVQVNAGLGRHWDTLSDGDRRLFQKFGYIAQLMGTIAMALAKSAVILLYTRITENHQKRLYRLLFAMVGVWSIYTLFSQSLACGAATWTYTPAQCRTQFPLRYVSIALNAISDAVLAAAFLPLLWRLNTKRNNRNLSVALFGARIIVSAVAIAQLVMLARMPKDNDPTWAEVTKTIFDQAVIFLSIITACLPRIQSALRLHTGFIETVVTARELSYTSRRPDRKDRTRKSSNSNTLVTDRRSETDKTSLSTTTGDAHLYTDNADTVPPRMPDLVHTRKPHKSVPDEELRLRPSEEGRNEYETRCFTDGDEPNACEAGNCNAEDDGHRNESDAIYHRSEFCVRYPSS